MFKEFAGYVHDESIEKINTVESLLKYLADQNILNGMYRVFSGDDIMKWNQIVEDAFPLYRNRIKVFAYDWLGRIFAIKKETDTVLLFEPGTGEVLDIAVDIVEFHNVEIAEYNEASLASAFFEDSFEMNNNYVLKKNECAGYKVPLFLGGEDNENNLEVSDMEVYWGIMASLLP